MPFGLNDRIIEQIRQVLSSCHGIDEAVLYGSRAKGNYKPGSDIDLTFKGSGVDLLALNTVSAKLEDLSLPYTFDLSVYHQIQNPDLIDHISRAGILFYRRPAERTK